jgi:site-specific DNA recombinase
MYYNQEFEIANIINYVRRSRQDIEREKKTGEDTLAAQINLMNNVLNKYGVPFVQKKEIGSGDKIETRPVFSEVLNELRKGIYDAIAVKDISRLGRGSYEDMGTIFTLLTEKRIFIITPNKIYDPVNASDAQQIRFEMFLFREEFEMTRQRLSNGRYHAAYEGKWMGQVPFGYFRNDQMRLKPKEGEKEVVQMIFDMYVNGYQGRTVRERAISTILKRAGIRTAKGQRIWNATQIKRVLKNDVYIGVSKFRTSKKLSSGKVVKRPEAEHIVKENAHEPIISTEVFEAAQKIMKSPTVPKTKFDAEIYELTGVITCKKCEKKAVINRYNRKRKDGSSYVDSYVRCRNGCFTTKYEFAEKSINDILKYLKDANEQTIFDVFEKTRVKQNEEEKLIMKENMQNQFQQQKEKLEKKLDFVFEKFEEGIYSNEDFLRRKKDIEAEMNELKILEEGREQSAATKEEANAEEVKDAFVKYFEAYSNEKDSEKKNKLLRSIFKNVNMEILEVGTKKKAPKIELEILLSSNLCKAA